MTRAVQQPTETHSIPKYTQAVAALLRLAKEFFDVGTRSPEGERRNLSQWAALRRFARLLCERQAMQLSLAEACELQSLLEKCTPSRDVAFLMGEQFEERLPQ